jgi:hypothetical protein
MLLGTRAPSRRARFALVASASLALVVSLAGTAGVSAAPSPSTGAATTPHLDHVFLVVEENNGFHDVIGNPAAPNLTSFARTFGVETDYFGVNGTSEPNYVGLLGGGLSGVNSDDAYWTQLVDGPSLISELDQAGITWKAYLQGLPHPDYQEICYPARCNGAPDSDPLYVSKHDGIQNFTTSLNPVDWARQVPIQQLATDLASGNVPKFDYIVPDECHDMHGDPPYCIDSGNIGDPQNQHLVAAGDAYLGGLVQEITNAPIWAKGNNAIVVTYDSGDNDAGCCDASPGGGQVATVVITSHGPRGLRDSQPANHYSLLSTMQQIFGLPCLRHTCDTPNVKPITSMFTVTGSASIATKTIPEGVFPTPTTTPVEPTSVTTETPSGGGWTVQKAELLGTSDNSLGAVGGSSPDDVWAVGDFLPDKANSNQDATLSLAEHFDGTRWSVVPTPNVGPNFNSFYGLAASRGKAWAVGEHLNAQYRDRALIEVWNGIKWTVADNPQPGTLRDMLFAASALTPSDVWVVGDQEGPNGKFETLAEHWNGKAWSAVPTPDPGTTGNHLYGVDALSTDDVWAVGQQLGAAAPDQGLVEHWNGRSWSVVTTPVSTSASVMLDAVGVNSSGEVWAAGEAVDPAQGGLPFVEHYKSGAWHIDALPASAGSTWSDLYGVAIAKGAVWVVGTYVNLKTENNETLVLQGVGGKWTVDKGPNPGSGSNILGGIANVDGQLWAAGVYDNGGSEIPLLEHNSP